MQNLGRTPGHGPSGPGCASAPAWRAHQEKAAARRAQAGLGFESAPHTGEKKALTGGARVAVMVREGRRSGPGKGDGPARGGFGPQGRKGRGKGNGPARWFSGPRERRERIKEKEEMGRLG